jgi:hypothetical protein
MNGVFGVDRFSPSWAFSQPDAVASLGPPFGLNFEILRADKLGVKKRGIVIAKRSRPSTTGNAFKRESRRFPHLSQLPLGVRPLRAGQRDDFLRIPRNGTAIWFVQGWGA